MAPDGENIGVRPLPEALTMAREMGLDLVEVADKANPPVCRIMDYGKYKYENAERQKESRKKSTNIVVKEMKYRPKIGKGDFDTKTRKVEKFLGEGHKVKVTIMFRGREIHHPELGKRILDNVAERVEDEAIVELYPELDGRNMIMVLAPDKKLQKAKRKRLEEEAEEARQAEATETEEDASEAPAETDATVDTDAVVDTPPVEANAPVETAPVEAIAETDDSDD